MQGFFIFIVSNGLSYGILLLFLSFNQKIMAGILCIESSTTVCSAAIAIDGRAVYSLREDRPNSHSSKLTVLIEQLLKDAGIGVNDLDAVAVSSGPGSYTGLRIGVSVSKGLCYGVGKPLIAIPSLEIMAAGFLADIGTFERDALLCPMIDARRMEVYSALFSTGLKVERPVRAEIIDDFSYADILLERPVYFFGDGAMKCAGVIKGSNAHFVDGIVPLAYSMAGLASERFAEERFEDVAYFEPFYLKDFIATVAKNKFF